MIKIQQIYIFKYFGTPIAVINSRCYAMKMADVCDDDGVSGASLRRKGALSSFSFFRDTF
jgi:hypothetical protein